MATIATIQEIRNAVETDAADSVIQRLIDSEELSIREQLTGTQRAQLPIVLWTGRYTPTLGSSADLTLLTSILSHNWVRFEGTVAQGTETPVFMADSDALDEDGGTATITPVLADGTEIAAGAFTATIDSTGKMLTVDATATTATIVLTRILGLTEQVHQQQLVSALIDLVELALLNRGLSRERVGQYDADIRDYQTEKWAILRRVVLSGSESVAY